MTRRLRSGEPSITDHKRIDRAHFYSHQRLKAANDVRAQIVFDTFRAELGASIRQTSPFLVALLERCGASLDELVQMLKPDTVWAYESANSFGDRPSWLTHGIHVELTPGKPIELSGPRSCGRRKRSKTKGVRCHVEIRDHSIDCRADFGHMVVTSRFGRLTVELNDELPSVLLHGSIGKPVGRLIDFVLWKDRRWPIVGFDTEPRPFTRLELTILAGVVPYRVPWARKTGS